MRATAMALLSYIFVTNAVAAGNPFSRNPFEKFTKNGFQNTLRSNIQSDNLSTDEISAIVSRFCSTLATIWFLARLSNVLSDLVKTVTKSVSSMSAANSTSTLPNKLASYIKSDIPLNKYEFEIACCAVTLPNDMKSDFSNLGGMQEIKDTLLGLIDDVKNIDTRLPKSILSASRSLLLFGPPGCGKSALTKAVAKVAKFPVISLAPSVLMRKYVGETSQLIKAVFSLALKMQPCLIFIDEMDSMFQMRAVDDHHVDLNLKTEFMQLWDDLKEGSARVMLVGATNRPQFVDSAIQRRFDQSLFVGPPSEADRADMFRVILDGVLVGEGFDWARCAALTMDYTPSDIVALCKAASLALARANRIMGASAQAEPKRLSLQDIEASMRTSPPASWAAKSYSDSDEQSKRGQSRSHADNTRGHNDPWGGGGSGHGGTAAGAGAEPRPRDEEDEYPDEEVEDEDDDSSFQ